MEIITLNELRNRIIEQIPDFDDADLFENTKEIEIDTQVLYDQIKTGKQKGFLSLDNDQGHEFYYCDLEDDN